MYIPCIVKGFESIFEYTCEFIFNAFLQGFEVDTEGLSLIFLVEEGKRHIMDESCIIVKSIGKWVLHGCKDDGKAHGSTDSEEDRVMGGLAHAEFLDVARL